MCINNCSCEQFVCAPSEIFRSIKTSLLPVSLILYLFIVIVAVLLHRWNQDSIVLSASTIAQLKIKENRRDKTKLYELKATIADQKFKRAVLLWTTRAVVPSFFVASIVLSYYVPWVYDYVIVPWVAGSSLFTNLVLFPALFWEKGEQSGLLPGRVVAEIQVCIYSSRSHLISYQKGYGGCIG